MEDETKTVSKILNFAIAITGDNHHVDGYRIAAELNGKPIGNISQPGGPVTHLASDKMGAAEAFVLDCVIRAFGNIHRELHPLPSPNDFVFEPEGGMH